MKCSNDSLLSLRDIYRRIPPYFDPSTQCTKDSPLNRPPYQHVGDAWYDWPRQWKRKARKALGQPASSDVGALARMLSDLRDTVEDYVGHPIESGAVAGLNLVALYYEDLHDAFEYVGLKYVDLPVRDKTLLETSAAYAGYGYGLCSDYTDWEACHLEEKEMPMDHVMAVLYTPTVLTVSLSITASAYYLFEPQYRYTMDFSLGYDARSGEDGDKDYWDSVQLKLEQIMMENPDYDRPSKILLMGDCVRDETFQQILQKHSAIKGQRSRRF